MNLAERLLILSRKPVIGRPAYLLLKFLGLEFPRSVQMGERVKLPHWACGLVLHERTRLGSDVTLFQGVTLGRSDQFMTDAASVTGYVQVDDGAIICAGAKVLFRSNQVVRVGRGTIVGANSVLTSSTGDNEIWVGAPARLVRARDSHS